MSESLPPKRAPIVRGGQEVGMDPQADRAGEQVDRDRPDVVVVAVQLGDDRRQGRADDGLVEGAEEQSEHDREEDLHLRALAQPKPRVFFEGRDGFLAGPRRECFHGGVQFLPCGSWLWWACAWPSSVDVS